MRTSFHHQPEAQHPIFQLSTSWQADYPIFREQQTILESKPERARGGAPLRLVPRVRPARAGCRAVRDSTPTAWYPSVYAPSHGRGV